MAATRQTITVIKVQPEIQDNSSNNGTHQQDGRRESAHINDNSNLPFVKLLAPLLFSLTIFGLFHHGRDRVRSTKYWRSFKRTVFQVYSTFIMVMLWLNVSRMLLVFRENTSSNLDLISKTTGIVWLVISAMQCTSLYIICTRKRNNIWQFCNQILSVSAQTPHGLYKYINKKCIVNLIIAWLVFVISASFGIYLTLFSEVLTYFTVPLTRQSPHLSIMNALNTVMQLYTNAAWIFPQAFRNIMCMIIYNMFRTLNRDFAKARHRNGISADCIRRFRKEHRAICKLLDTADNNLHLITGCSIALYVIMLCLLIYQVIWSKDVISNQFYIGIYIFWAGGSLAVLGFISIGSALVHHEVGISNDIKYFL